MEEDNYKKEVCSACDVERSDKKKVIFMASSVVLLLLGLIFEFNLKWSLVAEFLFIVTAIISGYNIAREGLSLLIFRKRQRILPGPMPWIMDWPISIFLQGTGWPH